MSSYCVRPGTAIARPRKQKAVTGFIVGLVAEREGFEPSVPFRIHTLSRRAPSTTRTSLQVLSTEHYYILFCHVLQPVITGWQYSLQLCHIGHCLIILIVAQLVKRWLFFLCGVNVYHYIAGNLVCLAAFCWQLGQGQPALAPCYSLKWYGTVVTTTFSFQMRVLRRNQPVWLCSSRCHDFLVSNSGIMTVI